LVNRGAKMMWLILGVIITVCSTIGLVLKIQEIKERLSSEN
jgi:hypothetical protein